MRGARPQRRTGLVPLPGRRLRADDFLVLGKAFESSPDGRDCVRIGPVGSATARLLPVRQAVEFAVTWIRQNRS